jgi:hypothetical protein
MRGKPDLVQLACGAVQAFGVEAVICIANQGLTRAWCKSWKPGASRPMARSGIRETALWVKQINLWRCHESRYRASRSSGTGATQSAASQECAEFGTDAGTAFVPEALDQDPQVGCFVVTGTADYFAAGGRHRK